MGIETFGIEGLPDTQPELQAVPMGPNPCVTVYKWKGQWAVRKEADVAYVFPTVGTALRAAKQFIEEMEQGVVS